MQIQQDCMGHLHLAEKKAWNDNKDSLWNALREAMTDIPFHRKAALSVFSLAFHVVLIWAIGKLPANKLAEINTNDSSTTSSPIHVKVAPKALHTKPMPDKKTAEKNKIRPLLREHNVPSPTAPLIPVKRREKAEEHTLPLPTNEQTIPNPIEQNVTETKNNEASPPPLNEALGNSSVSAQLSHLLPNANAKYRNEQQRAGRNSVADSAEGEDWPKPEPSVNNSDPTQPNNKAMRPKIVTTQFNSLAYRMELHRRFADAWGPSRMLPRSSNFVGKVGELIVYNVIINRDGSLRRLVNVSALEQPDRDFSSVDSLVRDFANSVFPMNPLPERLKDDPFVFRWPIMFLGFHYSFN